MKKMKMNPGISSETDLKEYCRLLKSKPRKSNKYKALLYDWEVEAIERVRKLIKSTDIEAKAVFARLLHYANEALFFEGNIR